MTDKGNKDYLELRPFCTHTSRLIEMFLIFGYEEDFILEITTEYIQSNINNINENELNEFKVNDCPKIINIISSELNRDMMPLDSAINFCFPLPFIIYIKKETNNNLYEPKSKNSFFQNRSVTNIYNIYSLMFYESILILNNQYRIFIPKIFMIISQFCLFNLFRKILNEIYNLFISSSIEIPIEIQIYNIVNFIPSPIHSPINYILFPKDNLNEYANINETEFLNLQNQKIINIEQLRMYPYFDYNLCEIFRILPYQVLSELFLHIFIENQIYVFSEDLEKLDIVITEIICFINQFDSNYNWSTYSIGEKEINDVDNSKIVGRPNSCIIGIADSYSEKHIKSLQTLNDNSFIAFDLDNKIFHCIVKQKNVSSTLKNEQEKFQSFFKFIHDCIYNEKSSGNIEKIIYNLVMNLKEIYNNLGYNQESENIDFYSDDILNNKKLLNIFYDFLINILAETNILFSFQQFNEPLNGKYYEIKSENIKNVQLNKYLDEEKIFLEYFSVCLKQDSFSHYMTGNIDDISIEFLVNCYISEYFMVIKKMFETSDFYTINYFDIIDKFYPNTKSFNVHFQEFYKYYIKNYQKFFFYFISSDNILKKIDSNKMIYKYKKIELDNSIILKYIQFLNQLKKEEIKLIFPSLIKIEEPPFIEIKEETLLNIIEDYFFEEKIIKPKELIIICFLIFLSFNLEKIDIVLLKTTILGNLWSITFFLRKYIYRLLYVYYTLCVSEVKIGKFNFLSKKNIYMEIYNILKPKGILPNIKLIDLINKITILYEENKEKIQNFTEEESKLNQLFFSIKEKDNIFTCDLEENGKIIDNKDEIIELSEKLENSYYNGFIKENIKLHFKTKELIVNNDITCAIYSIYKLFQTCNDLYNKYINSFDLKSIESDLLKEVIVNLIFYLGNNTLNRLLLKSLFLCLYNENETEQTNK